MQLWPWARPTPDGRVLHLSGPGVDALAPLVEALDLQGPVLLEQLRVAVGLGLVVGVGGNEDPAGADLVVSELPILALIGRGHAAGHASHRTAGDGAAEG